MRLVFNEELFFWRGPSPFHFVRVPEAESEELSAISALVSYGWGVIPVVVTAGGTRWKTSLFPKEGGYLVPIKASVRDAEGLELGDTVRLMLSVEVSPERNSKRSR
jgi:hypothetical protein